MRRRGLAWVLTALFGVVLATLTAAEISSGTFEVGEGIALGIAFTAFFLVGLAIVIRRDGHVIGWLFMAVALYAMTQATMSSVGLLLMESGGTHVVYALSNSLFSWPTLLGVMVVLIPLLFPTGRLPSPRWRWLAWVVGLLLGLATILNLFQRDVCVTYTPGGACVSRVPNPIGISALPNFEESTLGAFLFGVLALCIVAAGVSLVFRYRRAVGPERAQLKWITFSVGLLLSYILVFDILLGTVLGLDEELARITPDWLDPFGIFLAFVPLSVGLAILRYRLYEIDRIVSRTVTYGAVTVVLVAMYAALVVLVRQVLPDQSDLAVAASTLAVAALFNPLRRRVQTVVDRRFNRTRYDREQVVAAFGHDLRSHGDLAHIETRLLEAAAATMEPEHASLWMLHE